MENGVPQKCGELTGFSGGWSGVEVQVWSESKATKLG